MELSTQIKKYRTNMNLSQEELAEKVFVSRQTISNWENDKNYPDVKSLILLSETFQISLDTLIKGDIKIMKQEIDTQEYAKYEKNGKIFSIIFYLRIFLGVPLIILAKWIGMAIFISITPIGLYYAIKVEQFNKKHDIHTFKEIVAFTEGTSLSEIEKAREEGKRPYQKFLLAIVSALIAIISVLIWTAILKPFI